MIGVAADPAEHSVIREFFELFKTPWEFYREDRGYDVVLCTGDARFSGSAKLIIRYAGRKIAFDDEHQIPTADHSRRSSILSYQDRRIPIYANAITFPKKAAILSLLKAEEGGECAAFLDESGDRFLARIGYDLFEEIRLLLTVGQPPVNAITPALELHIQFLRDLITGSGIQLIEIPPVPAGYRFITCLTHDVDHPTIRQHKWDHTAFGFLYRASIGALRNFFRGRITSQDLLANWAAVLKLPFVHVGAASDIWAEFGDRYLEAEEGLHSTFFVIPFRKRPGNKVDGPAPQRRGAGYGARDISETIRKLMAAGCEVGLHGINAWLDTAQGREELAEIRGITGESAVGVRMHWLYYGEKSAASLEAAGAAYDSTSGYNETVGYRAGTTQVYKPLEAREFLELPMHAMDTALFYPSYLNLSRQQAKVLVGKIVDNAVQFGGGVTINWHDRSLAPERLWGEVYRGLIQDMKSQDAWFATAGQAVAWFRRRRAATFETDLNDAGAVRVKVVAGCDDGIPGLQLRTHKAGKIGAGERSSVEFTDTSVDETANERILRDQAVNRSAGDAVKQLQRER